ncbi:hypothetical protein Q5Y75_24565 [Ruegeria sp. 2205SS24-7]|uniref:hypothetical protein n=1 Tax=Ruegeria discodermiae TaxID=3064389 RepID=UPI0027404007|nr:hypothetical protein [Ruegeria sp. 2205SS24-7]MDP5220366.1 hypothetical protein [Ruegeria sp. 2205SS24-7]
MEKISIFAPSIMRNKLSVTEFARSSPNVSGEFIDGANRDSQVFDFYARGHPAAESRRDTLFSHKRTVTAWFNSVLNICLYADEVWIPSVFLGDYKPATNDPARTYVGDWFEAPHTDRGGPIAVHREYSEAWIEYGAEFRAFFKAITPLVNSGVIRIYNFARVYMDEIAEPLLGVRRWMTEREIENSYPDLFVAEGLLFAKALGVPYTATHLEEIDAMNASVAHLEGLLPTDRKAITLLSEAALPGMTLDPEVMVAARMDSEAFEGFRRVIRQISRDLPSIVGSANDLKEIKLLERDLLHPEIHRLNSLVSKSGILSRSFKPNAISFSAGALASLALKADPSMALASGALTTLGRVVLTELFERQKLAPEARFIGHLRAN